MSRPQNKSSHAYPKKDGPSRTLSVIPEESGSSGTRAAPSAWGQGPPKAVGQAVKPKPTPPTPPTSPTLTREQLAATLAPWPESERPTYEPLPEMAITDIHKIGDQIVSLIYKEVQECRGSEFDTPQTHIRLYPSPPYVRSLNLYVMEKAKDLTHVDDVKWDYGRDVITIVF